MDVDLAWAKTAAVIPLRVGKQVGDKSGDQFHGRSKEPPSRKSQANAGVDLLDKVGSHHPLLKNSSFHPPCGRLQSCLTWHRWPANESQIKSCLRRGISAKLTAEA